MMEKIQKGHKTIFLLKILMKIFFDNENPPGAEKKIFAGIMFFFTKIFFFNGIAKNHNFRGAKRKILMKNNF